MNPSSATDRPTGERATQVRSPLLWLLIPLMAGYLLSRWLPAVPPFFPLILGVIGAAASFGLSRICARRSGWWTISFLFAVFLCAWAWWLARVPWAPPEWDLLPPREVDVLVEISMNFRPSEDGRYWRGVARILDAPPVAAELIDQSVIYSTRSLEDTPVPPVGTRMTLRGVISRLDPERDEFDRSWENQYVFFRLRQGRLLEAPTALAPWRQWAGTQRAHWRDLLTKAPPRQEKRAGVLGAMLLGDRSLLDDDQKNGFLLSGTMHLFAVSGLHVMAVGGALLGVASLLPLSARMRILLSLAVLGIYVVVIGLPASAVRAYLMLAFYALGRGLWRRTAPFPAVVASAIVILIWDPRQLLGLGFQLSYTVVTSILLIGLPLAHAIEARFRRRIIMSIDAPSDWSRRGAAARRYVVQVLAISVAATVASAPLVVQHFEVFTPGAILLNPILVPVAALVVIDGVVVLLTGLLGLDAISQFFAHGAWLLIAGMEGAVDLALRLPGLFAQRVLTAEAGGWLLTIGFLWLTLCIHFRALLPRWPTIARLSVPLLVVTLALLLGTHALP